MGWSTTSRQAERIHDSFAQRTADLEFLRTQELVRRFLPDATLEVLDVAGPEFTPGGSQRTDKVHVIDRFPITSIPHR